MKSRLIEITPLLLLCAGLFLAGLFTRQLTADETSQETLARLDREFKKDVSPLLKKYCLDCHAGDEPEAEFSLDQFKDLASAQADSKSWEKVLAMLNQGEMPPEDEEQPSPAEKKRLVEWTEAQLAAVDCSGPQYPGRVTIRRLNRQEYNNTIRDLIGVDFKPAADFPSDDVGDGFDNIADVLSLPPLLLEKYLNAADEIITKAMQDEELRKRIVTCTPNEEMSLEDCIYKIYEDFMTKAYRRPVTGKEVQRLVDLASRARDQGVGDIESYALALKAVLVSPHFLFRIEPDTEENATQDRLLNNYELASRLSYFLWSSMPDDELFEVAKSGKLHDPDVLQKQVERMLKNEKSKALVENFAGQWLQLRSLANLTPDPARFPTFDESLRTAMGRETELFFETIMRENLSVLLFLDADFTFVNGTLAKHYGIENIDGEKFRRVKLSGRRGGVLTQASILSLTSNPTRTSPVKRGKWVMENILGTPPPPPPPGVEELSEDEEAELLGSLRERMEQHRADPICASCHERMDALGFSMENYDAIGGWRDLDGKFEIDPSGELPGGLKFNGPKELREILKNEKKELFCRCLSEKMLIYAIGRGLKSFDQCTVKQITESLADNDYSFNSLIMAIVQSDPFRKKGAKGGVKQ